MLSGKVSESMGCPSQWWITLVDMYMYQVLDLATVRLLQWPKIANIEWLKVVRRMRRHVECDDVVLPVVELEFSRVVAFVAIEDQQPVYALSPSRYIVVEVFNPVQTYSIGSLAIISGRDTLVG